MSTLRKKVVEEADPLVKGGQCFYDQHPKSQLKPEHTRCYVYIEPVLGRYFIADTGTDALLEAHRTLPESLFISHAAGTSAADTLSGYGKRNR